MEFTGSSVLVTLHSPPNAQVRGIVVSISGTKLLLSNVLWIASGNHTPHFEILSSNLADLEVLADDPQDIQYATPPLMVHQGMTRDSISPQQHTDANGSFPASLRGSLSHPVDPTPSSAHEAPARESVLPSQAHDFADPAILSFGKPPPNLANNSKPQSPQAERPPIPRSLLVEAARMSPTRATPTIPPPQNASQYLRTGSVATATLSEPFDDLSLERSHGEESEAAELGTDGGREILTREPGLVAGVERTSLKRSRRGGRNRVRNGTDSSVSALPPHVEEAESSPVLEKKQPQTTKRKNSKKQTRVEDTGYAAADGANTSRSRKVQPSLKERTTKALEAKSGWATEDATDIQELGDFDFAGNLSKFNKREVFSQLKADDKVSAEARLVGHNRLPKPLPGTAGGKNLHWTENVLEAPHVTSTTMNANKWTSEAGESEEDNSDVVIESERSSRRAHSRSSLLRSISRKGSGKGLETQLNPSITSVRSPSFVATASPKTRQSSKSFSNHPRPVQSSIQFVSSNKLCPTLSPLQMLEFEQFATTELGLSDDILTENAARGIAEGTLRLYRAHPESNKSLKPAILFAVGNHRAGARTLAAARQLRNHGFTVTVTIMERDESEYLDSVRQQATALRKAGGTFMKPASMLSGMTNNTINGELLVESLLGVHRRFEDLRGDDQAWFFEMVTLTRRSGWQVLSVDVPSGVDAVSGELTQADPHSAHPLAFAASAIVSLCVPKPYLAHFGHGYYAGGSLPLLYVIDVGIGNVVWKRLGNRRNKGIDWGDDWIKEVQLTDD